MKTNRAAMIVDLILYSLGFYTLFHSINTHLTRQDFGSCNDPSLLLLHNIALSLSSVISTVSERDFARFGVELERWSFSGFDGYGGDGIGSGSGWRPSCSNVSCSKAVPSSGELPGL